MQFVKQQRVSISVLQRRQLRVEHTVGDVEIQVADFTIPLLENRWRQYGVTPRHGRAQVEDFRLFDRREGDGRAAVDHRQAVDAHHLGVQDVAHLGALRAGAFGDFGFLAGEDVAQHEAAPGLDGGHVVEAERRRAALLDIARAQRLEIFSLAAQIALAQGEAIPRRLGHVAFDRVGHPLEQKPGHEQAEIG